MDIQPQFTSSTRTENQGLWFFEVGETIAPGYHQVIVTDETGRQSISPFFFEQGEELFVVQDQPTWYDRVEEVFPVEYAYALLGLLFLFVLTTLFIFWVAKRSAWRLGIFLMVLVLIIAACGALYLNRQSGGSIRTPIGSSVATEPVDARGTITAPFTKTPVAGVDLVLGDTSIRTGLAGQFAFPKAYVGNSIRMTHPLLTRAIDWKLSKQEEPFNIPFDPALYNAVSNAVNAEARGRRDMLFNELGKPEQGSVSQEVFSAQPPLFGTGNLSDQSLTVTGIRFENRWLSPQSQAIWSQVALVDLRNGNRNQVYAFIFQEGVWRPAF